MTIASTIPLVTTSFVAGCAAVGIGWWIYAAVKKGRPAAPQTARDHRESGQVDFTTLADTLDLLQEAVLLVDPTTLTVVYSNHTCQSFFRTSAAIPGRPLIDVCRSHKLMDLANGAIASGTPVRSTLDAGDNDNRHWSVYITPGHQPAHLRTSDSARPLLRVAVRDDTEQVHTEQIRREFIANASHELRTPITIIRGYIDNLLDGALDRPELATKFLKVARKHSQRTSRIIEDMLTISKLESGQVGRISAKSFSLKQCAERVVDQLQPIIDSQQATVSIDIDHSSESIVGDRFYWDQILFNLTENALKNNADQPVTITISAMMTGDHHTIKVTDNGVGIPASALPFIFKRFYRVQKDHSQTIKGTGLGLSIVKRAVEAHGGTIEVDSRPQHHTTFRVVHPVSPETDEPPA